ncbi:hypothetical protein DFJ74DRAFT_711988 [Hyaloraphidium curvatum]|nr:hypothetical protein DFJ74DRAFT_711988 [Hyaloraphidium curvatum]
MKSSHTPRLLALLLLACALAPSADAFCIYNPTNYDIAVWDINRSGVQGTSWNDNAVWQYTCSCMHAERSILEDESMQRIAA